MNLINLQDLSRKKEHIIKSCKINVKRLFAKYDKISKLLRKKSQISGRIVRFSQKMINFGYKCQNLAINFFTVIHQEKFVILQQDTDFSSRVFLFMVNVKFFRPIPQKNF